MEKNNSKSTKKVLMVAYVFAPMAYVGTHRTLRFCRYLPENDWVSRILTIRRGQDLEYDDTLLERVPHTTHIYRTVTIDFWRLWNARKKNGKRNITTLSSSQDKGIKKKNNKLKKIIKQIKLYAWELLTTPDHMVFWVPFAVIRGVCIQILEKCDIVYTSSPPHSEHLIGYILSRLFRIPWVADFRDPMLDSSGYNPVTSYRRWIDRKLERLIVSKADKILIISEYYNRIISERYRMFKYKFITFPNGYDPELYEGIKPDIYEKFTILYAGSFYANRNPSFFLHGFSHWLETKTQEEKEKIQVIFYGPPSPVAQSIVTDLSLNQNVFFKGMIPQDQLVPKQKGAHLLLLVIGFDMESRGTVTSKVYEYMACNRPILAIIPEGDAKDILALYPLLLLVNEENIKTLQHQLDLAFNQYKEKKRHGEIAGSSKLLEQQLQLYNARSQTKKLTHIFERLVKSRN